MGWVASGDRCQDSVEDILQYARKVVHKYLDPYGLSLGYELSDDAWERKREEYLGRSRYPKRPVVDRGRSDMSLQFRIHVWRSKRSPRWMGFQESLNDTCAQIMLAALGDKDIMPVHRYRQARRAVSVSVSKRPELEVVGEYKRLLAMRQYVWMSSVKETVLACESAFFRNGIVGRPDEYLKGKRFLEALRQVHIGHLKLDGMVEENKWEEDSKWDVKGIFVWRAPDIGM